ncbi:RNA-binding protein [Pedobacter sp.]|nr:RNA-binding protein [Candidatus Saccharibacteria bacterium]
MSKKLFVGSLAWGTTDEELQAHFAQCGTVESAKVITDRDTGRSKGFGFVEFNDDAEADAAVEKLNGSDLGGRQITVNEARPREERPRRDFGGDNRGGGNGGGGAGGSFRQRSW